MKICIGCDHGGYPLKADLVAYLNEKGYEIDDVGCFDTKSVDYPIYASKVAHTVAEGKADYGILVCSTGIGVSMCANKVNGIRAAVCTDRHLAEMSRRHNNANVLCLGGQVVTKQTAERIVDVFLNTEFEAGRHLRRVNMMSEIETGKL
jgi:ribose 5-phosphate isomerase B